MATERKDKDEALQEWTTSKMAFWFLAPKTDADEVEVETVRQKLKRCLYLDEQMDWYLWELVANLPVRWEGGDDGDGGEARGMLV